MQIINPIPHNKNGYLTLSVPIEAKSEILADFFWLKPYPLNLLTDFFLSKY